MGNLKINDVIPDNIKIGALQVLKVLVGTELVWPPPIPEIVITNQECCSNAAPIPLFTLGNDACCANAVPAPGYTVIPMGYEVSQSQESSCNALAES